MQDAQGVDWQVFRNLLNTACWERNVLWRYRSAHASAFPVTIIMGETLIKCLPMFQLLLIFTTSLEGTFHYLSHFTEEEIEVQRSKETFLRSLSPQVGKLGLKVNAHHYYTTLPFSQCLDFYNWFVIRGTWPETMAWTLT